MLQVIGPNIRSLKVCGCFGAIEAPNQAGENGFFTVDIGLFAGEINLLFADANHAAFVWKEIRVAHLQGQVRGRHGCLQ